MSCVGIPVDDNLIHGISGGGELLHLLRARGLSVSGVCIFPETSYFLAAVSVKAPFANAADEIAHVIWGSSAGSDIAYIIVVDDDIDPFNMSQVFHALATKCHPYRGIIRSEHTTRAGLAPWSNSHEQKYSVGGRAYFDCTWPKDWDPSEVPLRVSFADSYPAEVQEMALAKWRNCGY